MASRRALKAVLIDLSGTLHIEDVAVPGAQEALNRSDQAVANGHSETHGSPLSFQSGLPNLKK